ncbi:MAG TPA: acido-empty-quinoprotein group A [Terracidiphilus sp.]
MRLFRWVVVVAGVVFALGGGSRGWAGQELDSAQLLHPSSDSWPQYHGDYSGERHSRLSQISSTNVNTLGLAWAFQTNQEASIKSSPLLVDGILYFTVPDNIWAVDARSGHMLWHYKHPTGEGEHIGHRGVAMYKGWLYFTTPDAHLLSLNAKDGSVRWDKVIGDVKKGYWSTMAPLVVKDHVIAGVGGDLDNLPGLLRSFDPDTGALQWEWLATPPAEESKVGTGGTTWMTGTYDAALNLLYWGTGNPTPVLNGTARPGDNPWTCSIVALDPDTGKLAWGFSASPHDTHDWDAVETPVLVDADFHGKPRKMLMQSSRNGYFFVLDRTNGKSLLTVPYGPVNWASGVDKDGRPIPNPDKDPQRDGRLIAPDEGGMTNYRSPSFDPKTGLFIVDTRFSYSIYFTKPEDGAYGWAGADYGLWGQSFIQAIDYQSGKIRWRHDVGPGAGAGVLTTDAGLTFTGDSTGNMLALSTADGKTLWHAQTGAPMQTSPITYELDGRQYVVSGSGGVMFAWALPAGARGK